MNKEKRMLRENCDLAYSPNDRESILNDYERVIVNSSDWREKIAIMALPLPIRITPQEYRNF